MNSLNCEMKIFLNLSSLKRSLSSSLSFRMETVHAETVMHYSSNSYEE